MSKTIIRVSRWSAWMPGVSSREDWQAWADGITYSASDAGPEVSQIPPMLRRRLSPLGKMAASVIWPLLGDDVFLPSVFCSRHGELDRTVTMLRNLALQEQLSPTHFSLSVHNAIGGVYSIARNDPSAITALAVGEEGLSQALLETQLIMAERHYPEALCVIYDSPVPDEYAQPPLQPVAPYAAAFVLTTDPGDNADIFELSLELVDADLDENSGVPHTLQFLRFLLTSQSSELRLAGRRHTWRWARV